MIFQNTFKLVIIVLIVFIFLGSMVAFASNNSLPPTNIGSSLFTADADSIKPSECAGIDLTTIVQGNGTFSGTAGNDLILGGAGHDDIDGLAGDDCILAGDGDDVLNGNIGNDICIGGSGINSFTDCETEY